MPIAKSYDILSNTEKRERYDKHGILDDNEAQQMSEQINQEYMMKHNLKEVVNINISIQDIINGLTKKLKIERSIINTKRRTKTSEIIEIEFKIDSTTPINKPLVFENKGKKMDEMTGDLYIVINHTPTENYKLNKSNFNLITKQKISIEQSLCGFEITLPYKNNQKSLLIQYNKIIKPEFVYIIKGMGVLISDSNNNLKQTDIEIHFEIVYPKTFSDKTIEELKKVFNYTYQKTESSSNKQIVNIVEHELETDNEPNTFEQVFSGGHPFMGGIPGMGGMGGMGGIPGMGGMGGHSASNVQECRTS